MVKFISLNKTDVLDNSSFIKFATSAKNSEEANRRFLIWLKSSYCFSGKIVYRQNFDDGVYIFYVRASNCKRLD